MINDSEGAVRGAYEHLTRVASNPDELFDAAKAYRAAIEHAAAEKIREATDLWEKWSGPRTEHARGTRNAANLIDPEVDDG